MTNKNAKFKNQTNKSVEESDLVAVTGGTQFKLDVEKPGFHLQRPNPDNKGAMEEFYKQKKELLDKGINVKS